MTELAGLDGCGCKGRAEQSTKPGHLARERQRSNVTRRASRPDGFGIDDQVAAIRVRFSRGAPLASGDDTVGIRSAIPSSRPAAQHIAHGSRARPRICRSECRRPPPHLTAARVGSPRQRRQRTPPAGRSPLFSLCLEDKLRIGIGHAETGRRTRSPDQLMPQLIAVEGQSDFQIRHRDLH